MAEENGKQTPPYIPYATFDNFLNSLAEGVPDKIDSSLMRSLSGSTRSGLMVALRFLKLVDEEDNTFAALEKLAKAKDANRGPILRDLMEKSYSFLQQDAEEGYLDLTRATPAQLAEAIGEEGASGGTRDKAVNFFLKAAEVAGIPISPHILKRKHATGSARRARRSSPKAAKKLAAAPHIETRTDTARTPYHVLMNEIYNPDDMSKDQEQAVFTLARYLKTKGAEK